MARHPAALLAATMSNADQWPYIIVSYVVTLGGVAAYVAYLMRRARRSARQVAKKDRPWT
jgi:hypothetical protein